MTIIVLITGTCLVLVGLAMLIRLLVLAIRQPGVAELKLPWGIEARIPTAVFIGVVVLGGGLYALISAPALRPTGNTDNPPPAATTSSEAENNERDSVLPPPGPAKVHFTTPTTDTVIAPRKDVQLTGTVRRLGDDELHIVEKPDSGGSYYPVRGVAAEHDGIWRITHEDVGDDFDRGHNLTYMAVQANTKCQQFLAAATAKKYFKTWDNSACHVQQTVTIKVR